MIRCLADGHDDLPDDARLFIEVVADGNRVQKTEPLTRDSAVSSWRLNETIELLSYFTVKSRYVLFPCSKDHDEC